MKPKHNTQYNTWIRSKKLLLFLALFLALAGAAIFVDHTVAKILLLASALPFAYISAILSGSYYYFSENGGGWQAAIHTLLANKISASADLAKPDSVLDIGAGSGALAIKIAKQNSLFTITAIDYWGTDWEYSKRQCESNAALEGVAGQIEFLKASAAALPFADNSFDLVTSCLTFHEVQDAADKSLVIAEALRVLKPGGHFVFFDLFRNEKTFGNFATLLEKLRQAGAETLESANMAKLFPNCPKLLLHKKVLGHGALVSGKKA